MSQDQNNEVKITLTDDELEAYSDIKDQLVEEIKQELLTAGFEIVPQHYQGQDDLVKVVDRANQMKVAFKEEVAAIKDTYSEKVAAEKIKVLEVEHDLDMKDLVEEIDEILAKDNRFRTVAMDQLVNDPSYKEAKLQAFNVLNILQNIDANYQIIADIVEPLVAAKDTKALAIAGLLTKNAASKYYIEKAVDNINAYKSNAELHNFANSAKSFILENKSDFTLHTYMYNYSKGDGK